MDLVVDSAAMAVDVAAVALVGGTLVATAEVAACKLVAVEVVEVAVVVARCRVVDGGAVVPHPRWNPWAKKSGQQFLAAKQLLLHEHVHLDFDAEHWSASSGICWQWVRS